MKCRSSFRLFYCTFSECIYHRLFLGDLQNLSRLLADPQLRSWWRLCLACCPLQCWTSSLPIFMSDFLVNRLFCLLQFSHSEQECNLKELELSCMECDFGFILVYDLHCPCSLNKSVFTWAAVCLALLLSSFSLLCEDSTPGSSLLALYRVSLYIYGYDLPFLNHSQSLTFCSREECGG